MSIQQLLLSTRKSFIAIDAAMNTTGQNISNANTAGYARQRVTLQSDSNNSLGPHTQSTYKRVTSAGVSVNTVTRLRDMMLQASAREVNANLGATDEEHRIMASIEGLFPSTEGGRLQDLLNNFWTTWTDLADHPTDGGVRLAVRSSAQALIDTFHRIDSDLGDLKSSTLTLLGEGVDEINSLLGEVAELNERILSSSRSGSPDLAAEDRRDTVLDELSLLAPVKIQRDPTTLNIHVSIDGMAVLQGTKVVPLELTNGPAGPQVQFSGTGVAFEPGSNTGGKLGAWLRLVRNDGEIDGVSDDLDSIASGLASAINAVHTAAVDEAGVPLATQYAFFDQNPTVTAANIALSADIAGDNYVRIGRPDGYVLNASGQVENMAYRIAGMREQGLIGGRSVENATTDLLSSIGSRIRDLSSSASGNRAVADHLTAMEKAVSGVNLDEEMTNLIQLQQAFQASARVLTTLQEMMDTLYSI